VWRRTCTVRVGHDQAVDRLRVGSLKRLKPFAQMAARVDPSRVAEGPADSPHLAHQHDPQRQ
jgi:hypothetical protein